MAEGREPFLGLNAEDEKLAKDVTAKALMSAITQPLTTTRVLIQLGHEPFPLSTGRTLIVTGRNAYFLPNLFSYAKQLAQQQGWRCLFTGLDSAICSIVVTGCTASRVKKHIDTYYPDLGGAPEIADAVEEEKLTDHESFKRTLRRATRDSVVRLVAITVARPFTVTMIRQIAQLIGKETKYTTVFGSMRVIGMEEGPAGLFAGIIPQILGEALLIFGVHFGVYAVERAIVRSPLVENAKDEKSKEELKNVRSFVHAAVPFFMNSFSYPYGVVSTVMAVTGSGLLVSFLPYSPSFSNWQNAWDYLKPHGLKRGARMFLREQRGAVSVGADQQLYANNKHFA